MSAAADRLLRRATTRALEELALILVGGDGDGTAAPRGPLDRTVTVAFDGRVRGRLIIETTSAVAAALAENMLGEERPGARVLATDALGEVANVVCGNVLAALVPDDGPFALSAPRAHRAGEHTSSDEESPCASTELEVESGWVSVRLLMAAPAAVR